MRRKLIASLTLALLLIVAGTVYFRSKTGGRATISESPITYERLAAEFPASRLAALMNVSDPSVHLVPDHDQRVSDMKREQRMVDLFLSNDNREYLLCVQLTYLGEIGQTRLDADQPMFQQFWVSDAQHRVIGRGSATYVKKSKRGTRATLPTSGYQSIQFISSDGRWHVTCARNGDAKSVELLRKAGAEVNEWLNRQASPKEPAPARATQPQ